MRTRRLRAAEETAAAAWPVPRPALLHATKCLMNAAMSPNAGCFVNRESTSASAPSVGKPLQRLLWPYFHTHSPLPTHTLIEQSSRNAGIREFLNSELTSLRREVESIDELVKASPRRVANR